jgi:hypothetical protein
LPMLKEVRGIAQGKPSFRGMNLQVKRQRSRLDRRQSRGHDLEKTLGAIQRRQRIASVVFERNGNLCEKAQVIGDAIRTVLRERVFVMQMEAEGLAVTGQRPNEFQHDWQA